MAPFLVCIVGDAFGTPPSSASGPNCHRGASYQNKPSNEGPRRKGSILVEDMMTTTRLLLFSLVSNAGATFLWSYEISKDGLDLVVEVPPGARRKDFVGVQFFDSEGRLSTSFQRLKQDRRRAFTMAFELPSREVANSLSSGPGEMAAFIVDCGGTHLKACHLPSLPWSTGETVFNTVSLSSTNAGGSVQTEQDTVYLLNIPSSDTITVAGGLGSESPPETPVLYKGSPGWSALGPVDLTVKTKSISPDGSHFKAPTRPIAAFLLVGGVLYFVAVLRRRRRVSSAVTPLV